MVTLEFIKENMPRLKGDWAIEGDNLIKDILFKDFKDSIHFVNKVAIIAEKHNHHPLIMVDVDHVRLSLTSHEHSDLTEKDFAVAEDIDKITLSASNDNI